MALLNVAGERTGVKKESADAGHGIGAEQRETQRLLDVPGEFAGAHNPRDFLIIRFGIEFLDFAQPIISAPPGHD